MAIRPLITSEPPIRASAITPFFPFSDESVIMIAVDFLEVDDLVLGQLRDDDPSQLHLDGHETNQQ